MTIAPMHQWKVPLKYQAMLLFPSGPIGRGASGRLHGLGGGVPAKWREQKIMRTYIQRLHRNSKGVLCNNTEAPLIATATAVAVAAARHLLPPQQRSLRGFIVVVVIVVIITAITTVFPLLSCDLFDCCVFVCHRVPSPSSSGGGHPTNHIRHCHCCRCHGCRRRHHRRCRHCHCLLCLRRHLTLPPHNLFDCCLCVLVPCRVVSP
jgi:hypothetical protein